MSPPAPPTASRNAVQDALRLLFLILFAFGALGTLAELLLLEHHEEWRQWLPMLALGLGVGAALWAGLARSRGSVLALRAAAAVLIAVGTAGLVLHYQGNAEFELEMMPSLAGFSLFWESLHGATPALAPGAIIWLGLVGLTSTYRHPALVSPDTGHRNETDSDPEKGRPL